MPGRSIPALFAALLLTCSSCIVAIGAWDDASRPNLRGSGVRVAEDRDVAEFDRLSVGGWFEVVVHVGEPRRVRLRADDNLLPHVRTQVRDGRLEVRVKDVRPRVDEALSLEVWTPALRELDLAGSVEFTVTGLDEERLELDVSGSCSGDAAGRVGTLEVDASGSARLDLSRLVAQEVDLDASGSAHVQVHAERSLDVDASGSVTVVYRGSPALDTDLSGSCSVRRASDG